MRMSGGGGSRDLGSIKGSVPPRNGLFSLKIPIEISDGTCSKKMPETSPYMNGFQNGHTPPEFPNGEAFLFTSESVGEGHPGKYIYFFNEARPRRLLYMVKLGQTEFVNKTSCLRATDRPRV